MNLLAIVALLYIIRNRKEIEPYKLVLGTALSVCTIFLSNPFLGLEWASRLFMLAYIPIGIVYLIIYNSTVNKWFKWSTLSVFAFLLMLSIGTTTFDKTYMAMDNASFLELQTIKDKHIISKQDVIVARQSLRILSNWVFESKGIDKYLLTKEAFGKYPNVYLIKQIKGRNPHTRGHEPNVGDSTALVYQGVHFEVYKLMSNAQLPEQAEKIFKGIKGTIQSFSGNTILVVDVNTNKIRVVEFDAQNNSFPKLQKGMKVEINGEWKAFSLNIVAETIKEIHHFDNQ
jgi:hypothetical protein